MVKSEPDGGLGWIPRRRAGGQHRLALIKKREKKGTTSVFPQEVDVINIALVLPVFSSAVVKATLCLVLVCIWEWQRWRAGGWLRWVGDWVGGVGGALWCSLVLNPGGLM